MMERELLTMLDVLAALGGFESALILVSSSFLSFFQANSLNNFLAVKLYSFSQQNSFFLGPQKTSLMQPKNSKIKGIAEDLP